MSSSPSIAGTSSWFSVRDGTSASNELLAMTADVSSSGTSSPEGLCTIQRPITPAMTVKMTIHHPSTEIPKIAPLILSFHSCGNSRMSARPTKFTENPKQLPKIDRMLLDLKGKQGKRALLFMTEIRKKNMARIYMSSVNTIEIHSMSKIFNGINATIKISVTIHPSILVATNESLMTLSWSVRLPSSGSNIAESSVVHVLMMEKPTENDAVDSVRFFRRFGYRVEYTIVFRILKNMLYESHPVEKRSDL
mmetsp:Transcript_7045/g.26414  ORF Transcript_7045/g.26414 Transcript_7045/m.26414 type:complete len:250 (+) Transcript_7045:129-878(+)